MKLDLKINIKRRTNHNIKKASRSKNALPLSGKFN